MPSMIVPALASFNSFLQQNTAMRNQQIETMRNRRRQDAADEKSDIQFADQQRKLKMEAVVQKIVGNKLNVPHASDFLKTVDDGTGKKKAVNPIDVAQNFADPSIDHLSDDEQNFYNENSDEIRNSVVKYREDVATKFIQGQSYLQSADAALRTEETYDKNVSKEGLANKFSWGVSADKSGDVLTIIKNDGNMSGLKLVNGELVPISGDKEELKQFDLNKDGKVKGAEIDALGYGSFKKDLADKAQSQSNESERLRLARQASDQRSERTKIIDQNKLGANSDVPGVRFKAYSQLFKAANDEATDIASEVGSKSKAKMMAIVEQFPSDKQTKFQELFFKKIKMRVANYGTDDLRAALDAANEMELGSDEIAKFQDALESLAPDEERINEAEISRHIVSLGRKRGLKLDYIINAETTLQGNPDYVSASIGKKRTMIEKYLDDQGKPEIGGSKKIEESKAIEEDKKPVSSFTGTKKDSTVTMLNKHMKK